MKGEWLKKGEVGRSKLVRGIRALRAASADLTDHRHSAKYGRSEAGCVGMKLDWDAGGIRAEFRFTRYVGCSLSWSLDVKFSVELDQETDGRWIAEVPDLPGVLAYGPTRQDALACVQALALRVLAERLEHGETAPESFSVSFRAA